MRVEFQDGTRKAPTQDYHGSGRPHIHVLVFASDDALLAMSLDKALSATMPSSRASAEAEEAQQGAPADVLAEAVRGSQLDRGGRSGWPVQLEENHWDEEGRLRLLHTEEDKEAGLRPYFVDIMEALRCHQDFQYANDAGALRAYVAKYVSKFSDANQDEWLNDAADGNVIATTVLSRYKPFAPEMALQMFGAQFRQWLATTESLGKRDFVAPWPDQDPMPREVGLYLSAEWAAGRVSLLDFLRKTNADGEIIGWLKKRHQKSGSHRSLEACMLSDQSRELLGV